MIGCSVNLLTCILVMFSLLNRNLFFQENYYEADHEATVAPSLTDSMSTDTFLSMLDDTVDDSSTSLYDYSPVQDDCPVEIP